MIRSKKTIRNFWTIFFALLALLAIASAVATAALYSKRLATMRMSQVSDDNVYKISQENGYRQALYSACDSMKNLDAELGKAAASHDGAHQAKLLTGVVIHANAVNQSLADLPLADSDNLSACRHFVNQTQDYATYLIGRLGNGQQLTQEQRTSLRQLDNVASRLQQFLQQYSQSDSGMFMVNGNGLGNVGALSDSLDNVEDNAFTYEKLIYDGPFSESAQKVLPDLERVPQQQVASSLEPVFGVVRFCGEISHNGDVYLFEGENGRVMTDVAGHPLQFESYSEPTQEPGPGAETCIGIAEEFCRNLGYDVEGVWVSKTQDFVTYVNCATVVDGVVVYPDLIKVAVGSNGKVVGLEARSYLLNHRNWDVSFGDVTEQQARAALETDMHITNVARALIEKDGNFLTCFEFETSLDGRQYYVYVDSHTGQEADIFKVIEETEGHTVM